MPEATTDSIAAWRNKLTCFSPTYIEHTVSQDVLRFYPLSVGMIFRLKIIGKPLARSLTVLFSKNERDSGTKDVIVKDDDSESLNRIIEIDAITDGLAKIRHDQKVDAVEGLVEALTSEENAKVVGEVFMDSLREVFPQKRANDWPPPAEFINQMPLPVLGSMMMGVLKANKDVFGPLTDQVTAAVTNAVTKIGNNVQTEAGTTSDAPSTSPAPDAAAAPEQAQATTPNAEPKNPVASIPTSG